MRWVSFFAWLALPVSLLAQRPDFVRDIQPVLTGRCQVCHTGDTAQAGLKLHTREDLLRGGKSGPAIVPGDSRASLLLKRIEGKVEPRMPAAGPPLDDKTIALFRAWIDEGAMIERAAAPRDRLAPIAPRKPDLPAAKNAHPIDRFLGTSSARTVSDALFARRLCLDLWGLLPPPAELQAFLRNRSPGKRARLVDTLLENREQYADHWISFWNDLLRNDEGVVYHGERKSITPWLLGALRDNLPYDRMVRALLNPVKEDDPDGFLLGMTWRGVVSASQSPPMQAAQNSAQVFLGMNLKCAACHDSFVNRWKLRDTYGLAAMFSNETLELVRCDVPTGRKAEARFPIDSLKVDFNESLESRRRAAAEWFTRPDNGRFARTIVNRYWKQLFGRGLVEPVDDMDAEPWNADLLDWLASDFAEHGYDLQHLLRRIMTSRAYALPAVAEEKAPGREYVFRGPRLRRLTAEQFEDAISQVTGDWRVLAPRNQPAAHYTREWGLKSDPLSRALGRPIRDQVYTERSAEATTLQALELTNGPLLARRLERAARTLLGESRPSPVNLFDSTTKRSGFVDVDVDIAGEDELWLVIEDVDSYSPKEVLAGWVDARLLGPQGESPLKLSRRLGPVPSTFKWDISGKGYTRFRARAVIDDACRTSEISPAVRFFVFGEKPDLERLVRIEGPTPAPPPPAPSTGAELTDWLYLHLLARKPTPAEARTADALLGQLMWANGVEDLLWALLMSPEFQFIH